MNGAAFQLSRLTMLRSALYLFLAASPVLGAPAPITALAYHPSGRLLVAGLHGDIAVIDPTKGEVAARIGGFKGRVTATAFSPDGKLLSVASGEPARSGEVKLFAVPEAGFNLQAKGTIAGPKDVLYALVFAPDGKTLAGAGYDRVIRIWDTSTQQVTLELKDHSDTVYGLAFNSTGTLIASASADRAVKVWDAKTGKRLYTLAEPTDWLYALAWSPDGKFLAAAGVDKSIRVWQADAMGGKLVHSVFAHTEPVVRLVYSADSKTLFSMSEGKSIKKWDAAKMTEPVAFPAQGESLLTLALRPDAKQLAIGRFDGVCQLLEPDTGKLIQQPLPEKPKPPTIGKLAPNFATRGTTVRLTVDGQFLSDDVSFATNVAGVTAKVLGGSATKREVEVAIAADVPAGPVQIMSKTGAGTSAAATLIVDRYPAVTDSSAIDSARRGQLVRIPLTLAGTLDRAGQADYFRFTATKGQEIGGQLLSTTIGSKLEPHLELTDATGRVLVEGANGLIAFKAPADGTYALGVRDKEYRGGADQFYRLHLGDVPVVTAIRPLGVQRGTTANVTFVGANVPATPIEVRVPADATVGSRLPIPLPKGERPLGELGVVVGEFPQTIVESGRASIATPGTADGTLLVPNEVHQVRFAAKKGERLIVEVQARRSGSPLDSVIELRDAKDQPVGRTTLRCVARSFITFRDHDSAAVGMRLETWNDLTMNDFVFVGNELLRIHQLPLNPDADCNFYSVAGQRVGYLDTTPGHHPNGAPLYKVELHPPGKTFPPNGMPVFRLTYRNDDGPTGYGKDSRLVFDPPADGDYFVRVADARGQGGPDFGYRLTVRPPRPDFSVSVGPMNPPVGRGGAVPINVTVNRTDDFAGPIGVQLVDLPPGFEAPATFIEADQQSTTFALFASSTAVDPAAGSKPCRLVARATIDGKEVVREASAGLPKVIDPGDLVTATAVGEVSIKPGTEARLTVKIERRNGFKGRVPVDVRGLPHGVRVLDVGLNGILITERDTEREFVIYAEPWVKPMEHPFVVLSKREAKGTDHAARSVMLRVKD